MLATGASLPRVFDLLISALICYQNTDTNVADNRQRWDRIMIATLPSSPAPRLWLLAGLAAAALWPVVKPGNEAATALPWILCSSTNSEASARPRPVVETLRSEPLATAPGKYVTAQLVHLPPSAFSPRHVHGGDVTVYVLKGTVRSEHAGLPAADFHAGDIFYEPYGTTHVFIENLSSTESADALAITVHDKGAPLTTFLD
jgi:quercetin dioxygenase-like cupin family protein